MPTIYNKVELDGTTLLDLSQDTASSASHIRSGYTAHLNDGTQVTGTYSGSSPTIQSLNITPSTSQQTFNASNVDGYKPVTVAAMTTMTLPTSAASSATSGYTSKATIGRSTAAQYINIPPGYNSAGAYYVISAVANGSATAPASISDTAASVSTGTNTLTLTKTVSVTPTVSAGYVSAGTAGNSSVSLTASVTTKAAATITPGTSNQTIASGTYLTGTQTISGDTNLVAGNIKSGVSIFGVSGTYTGSDGGGSGGSVTQDQDGYIVLPSTGGGSPSATQHTIYFEFTDSTDATINAWYDSSFISDAITATEPTTYGQKTVDTASLDGVEWYHRSTTQWETLLDDDVQVLSGDPYNAFWISDLASVYPTAGSVWRITIDSVEYVCTAQQQGNNYVVGNPLYNNGSDDGSGIPFCFINNGWGAWNGGCAQTITGDTNHALKVERQITA